MARRDVSQNDSAYSPHLLDALMLASFLAGFSVFLAIVTCQPEEAPQSLSVKEAPVTPIVVPQVDKPAPPPLSLAAVKALQNRPRPRAITIAPNPARTLAHSEEIVAAVGPEVQAEKPAVTKLVETEEKTQLSQRPTLTELELEANLRETDFVPTIGLNLAQAESLVNVMRTKPPAVGNDGFGPKPTATVLALLSDDMERGIPFSEKANCKLDDPTAQSLESYSTYLHKQITTIDESVKRRYPSTSANRRDDIVSRALGQDRRCQSPDAVPALMQILQVESTPVRQELIELLSKNHTQEATKALANRAVFDLSPEVRHEASQALRDRTRREYRQELLDALSYPWAPVAWHAAETLVAVKDKQVIPELVELLDAPDPSLPFQDSNGEWKVRELAKVNHAQNCLLCHAPSRDEKDPVRGFVPLPRSQAYYSDRTTNVLVRADVTYLRQDFSVVHNLDETQSRPNLQRFDYLVRTRKALPHEKLIGYGANASTAKRPSYPQREAVLFALRKLTGENPGSRSEDWRRSPVLVAEN